MKIFKNKILLITGGTGSFGSTIIKRFIHSDLKEIRVFSRDEKKQEDMRLLYKSNRLKFHIGDVRNFDSIKQATQDVDYIFHAAALKQVPSCEFFPMEAVRTNILGTENVLNAAIRNNVKKTVILSTDKAVYPINAMGVSKAMMEKLVLAKSNLNKSKKTIICITRYGNVIGSRGSVIPLFINLIKDGKALTVTDPKMTRFMMSLEDSVNLVLYAFEHAQHGDIFVQKAPATNLENLAKVIIEIFDKNNKMKIIGTRHGEKLYETLVSREEMSRAKDLGSFYCIPTDSRSLNYTKYHAKGEKSISGNEDFNSNNTRLLHFKDLKKLLMSLDFVKDELNV